MPVWLFLLPLRYWLAEQMLTCLWLEPFELVLVKNGLQVRLRRGVERVLPTVLPWLLQKQWWREKRLPEWQHCHNL